MITTSLLNVLRKGLLAFGYPRLEVHSDWIGPYPVGAIQTRIPVPDAPACQIFYPAAAGAASTTTRSYFRPAAVDGLIEYLRFGDGLFQLLSDKSHPCNWQAEPAVRGTNDDDGDDGRFPLVLFSHGLAGTYEMYTELCTHVASLGYCVVAVEHEDGSAAYAQTSAGRVIPYQRPNNEPYSRQKVWNLRTPMLHRRVDEMERIVRYFVSTKTKPSDGVHIHSNDDDDDKSQEILMKLVGSTDPGQLHLMGHSFGGATQLLAAQRWTSASHDTNDDIDSLPHISSLTVLDAWAFSLKEDVVQQGLTPKQRQSVAKRNDGPFPLLSIISEDWITNSETEHLKEFLSNSVDHNNNNNKDDQIQDGKQRHHHNVYSYYARNSVHQSFSDSEAWFPSWIARRAGNRGPHEKRHDTIRTVVQAWDRMLLGKPILQGVSKDEVDDSGPDKGGTVLRPFVVRGVNDGTTGPSMSSFLTTTTSSVPSALETVS